MLRVWDGFLSGLGALATLAIVGVPLWGAIQAVQAGLIPFWAWGPIVLLAFVGVVMFAAFGRKALRGVHPLRDRRR